MLILGAALPLVIAAPAAAQDQILVAPPGNGAVQEYTEVVPGAGGDRPAGGKGGSAPQTPAKVLGHKTAAQLDRLGPDGRATAAAAAAGAPAPQTPAQRAKGGTLGGTAKNGGRSIAATDGGGRVSSIATALTGQGGGMGLLFPLVLGGTLAGAVVLLGARRVSRRP
jgi:hypothetical protein